MRPHCIAASLAAPLAIAPAAPAAGPQDDIAELRRQMQILQSDYQQRMQAMEDRLRAAEEAARRAEETAAAPPPPPARPASANAFNPGIGLILDAKYREFANDPQEHAIPGFPLGEEAGLGEEGLAIDESELNIDATIDDKFYGSLTLALANEDGGTEVELEEAYIQTLALPQGFTVKAGRFFSAIGYLNSFHAHSDDFADRPLPYRAFLNNQYFDDGVQVKWVAPTDLYLELGAELLRGARFPAGGAADDGKGTWSVFVHTGGDAGTSHSWRAGLSYLAARADGREAGEENAADSFTGDSDLLVADLTWKWAPDGNPAVRNLTLQGEWFKRREDGRFTPFDGDESPLSFDASGWYVQGVYQFRPRWRAGLRYAELDAEAPGPAFAGTALDPQGLTPRTYSAMLDWSNSEFSRIRLQYSRDESGVDDDDQWTVQYIMSLGAHGGHPF